MRAIQDRSNVTTLDSVLKNLPFNLPYSRYLPLLPSVAPVYGATIQQDALFRPDSMVKLVKVSLSIAVEVRSVQPKNINLLVKQRHHPRHHRHGSTWQPWQTSRISCPLKTLQKKNEYTLNSYRHYFNDVLHRYYITKDKHAYNERCHLHIFYT